MRRTGEEAWRRWYWRARWKRRAAEQKTREPHCRYCLAKGILNDGSKDMFGRAQPNPKRCYLVADHIEPHRGDWDLFLSGELQTLCPDHHDLVKNAEARIGFSREIGADGFPIDPKHPANGDGVFPDGAQFANIPKDLSPATCSLLIVMGPPGSGKTTRALAFADDPGRVIDLDLIRANLTDRGPHEPAPWATRDALDERERRLRSLNGANGRYAFVVGAPMAVERRLWIEQLRPSHVEFLREPRRVCEARIRNDAGRGKFLDYHLANLSNYFTRFEPKGLSAYEVKGGRGSDLKPPPPLQPPLHLSV